MFFFVLFTELRSIDPISTKTTTLKTCVSSTSVQSNRWHLLSVTHTSLDTRSATEEGDYNAAWYLDGKPLKQSASSSSVPYPKLTATDSMSNCMVGGRFSGRLGGKLYILKETLMNDVFFGTFFETILLFWYRGFLRQELCLLSNCSDFSSFSFFLFSF